MLAILFSVSLVCMWVLIGHSLFVVMRTRSDFCLRSLIAPALGLAINIIVLFTLSRIGFAIKLVAIPLSVVGILLAGHFLIAKQIIWKRQAFLMSCLFMLAAIIPFVWPLFKFGFGWLAFVNGDMSYYSLSSSRFLNFGYSVMPASGNIFDDMDHSLAYWYFPNKLGHRSGADLMLAYFVGTSGLTAHQVYMPLIIAFHVCVAAGAGALTLISSRKWSSALWAMGLVGLSPLLSLEVTMQLLAQAIGLALLTSLCVAYIRATKDIQTVAWSVVTVLLFSALAIAYSEIVPFFGLYVILTEAVRWKKWIDAKSRKVYLRTIAISALGVILLLNSYLFDVVKFVSLTMDGSFKSAAMTMQANGLSLFPHFFVPSGGALLWGWMPLSGADAISLIVVLGLIATVLFLGLSLVASIRGMPSARMSIVMFAVSIPVFVGGNGFGLFKIAMFIQPFMLATCIVLATLYLKRRLVFRVSLSCLVLSFVPALMTNIKRVSVDIGQSRVPYASTAELGSQLKELSSTARLMKSTKLYSDTTLRELFLLQSYYFKGVSFSSAASPSTLELPARTFAGLSSKSDLPNGTGAVVEEREFYFDPSSTGEPAKFYTSGYDDLGTDTLITSSKEFSPINRFNKPSGRKYYLQSIRDLKNYLVFRQTSLGTSYVGKSGLAEGGVVLWGIEPDPLFIGQTMSSVGRYHLYEVLGSKQESRMLLSLSASMNRHDDFVLPAVNVLGSKIVSLPLVGRGSARVASSPISPCRSGYSDYMGIDFGREGSFLEPERTGAMRWFGNNIKLDIRKTVAFARDISYITPEQYALLKRPQALQNFPSALEDPGLEYSGIFEDGWISDVAYVVLRAPLEGQQRVLNLTGQIPDIGGAPFSTNLTISINDQVVYKGLHTKGGLRISVPITGIVDDGASAKVQIESSALQRLPHGDGRPVSLLISDMEFMSRTVSGNPYLAKDVERWPAPGESARWRSTTGCAAASAPAPRGRKPSTASPSLASAPPSSGRDAVSQQQASQAAPVASQPDVGLKYEATLAQGIDFRRNGYPVFVASVSGMSEPEPWGRWSQDKEIEFRFKDPLPRKFRLKILAGAFDPSFGLPFSVVVGKSTQQLIMRNGQSELQPFELEFDQVQGSNTIKIIVPNPKSPAEIDPKIPDSRALGLAIQSLQIVR